ncbi:MAG: hypothetical protein H7249_06040 [Chitinophagaceae bacterium]|nr:hypothetical protein [Oligoflexus sp.]
MAQNSTDKDQTLGLGNGFVEATLVSRGVDDGDQYVSVSIPERAEAKVHKISDALLRTKQRVTHKIHDISDTVGEGVKAKAAEVSDTLKKSVVTVDTKVKANPYLYAVSAVGVGFIIGRIFIAYRARQSAKVGVTTPPHFQNYADDLSDHTGVHVRPEKTYNTGAAI